MLPAVENISREEFKGVLNRLENLLANLPKQLPSSDGVFSH